MKTECTGCSGGKGVTLLYNGSPCALGEHIMSDEKDEHGNPIPDLKKARDITCPGDCIVLELEHGALA